MLWQVGQCQSCNEGIHVCIHCGMPFIGMCFILLHLHLQGGPARVCPQLHEVICQGSMLSVDTVIVSVLQLASCTATKATRQLPIWLLLLAELDMLYAVYPAYVIMIGGSNSICII